MNHLDTTLKNGLIPIDLDDLIQAVTKYPSRNEIAAFLLLTVLKKVRAEWQEEHDQAIASERANALDQELIPIIRQFGTRTLDAPFAETEDDLQRLIEAHGRLYQV